MSELKKLEFKRVDIEPEPTEEILVELGGREYTAHCPNDYEFLALIGHVAKLQADPSSIDIAPILSAFFSDLDVKRIDKAARHREISFVGELAPALSALSDHYKPFVEKRMKDAERKMAPKAP